MQGSFCRLKESKEAGHCLKKNKRTLGNIYLMIILQDINNLCSFDRKIYIEQEVTQVSEISRFSFPINYSVQMIDQFSNPPYMSLSDCLVHLDLT